MSAKSQIGSRLGRLGEPSQHDSGRVPAENPADALGAPALAALDQIADAVVVTDHNWHIRYMNSTALECAGLNDMSDVTSALADVLPVFDQHDVAIFRLPPDARWQRETVNQMFELRRPDARSRPVEIRVSPASPSADNRPGWTVVLRDLSRESGLEKELLYQANHDALTQLPNRLAFESALALALQACAENTNIQCAVLYLDIDLFKIINDTCGHSVGDRYLRTLAKALRERVRESDTLARLGGDEFGVLLHGCSVARAHEVADELCSLVKRLDYTWEGQRYNHTVSIGIAPVDGSEQTAASVLSAADVACYTAKDTGRDRVEDCGGVSVPKRQAQMHWVSRVARACDDNRFVMYQQPIVPMRDDDTSPMHYELLLRMVDTSGKVIMPGAFIHAAERYNIMPRVDRWAVRHVLENLIWREHEAPDEKYLLSVNLSGTSLSDPTFRRFVMEQLDESPIAPGTLCFEVTETAAISNIDHVARFMHRMRERGCLFSLDDFGTGLSSFAYLRELPVDYLKIDGQFIRQLDNDRISASLVRAFNDIGNSLGIKTVAELVEDESTARALHAIGVNYGQGFYFARPRKLLNRLAFVPIRPAGLCKQVAV